MTHWDESPHRPHGDEPPTTKPRGWNDDYGDPDHQAPGRPGDGRPGDGRSGDGRPRAGRHSADDDATTTFNGFRRGHTDARGIRPISPGTPPARPVSPA